jgi:hypothetical protein
MSSLWTNGASPKRGTMPHQGSRLAATPVERSNAKECLAAMAPARSGASPEQPAPQPSRHLTNNGESPGEAPPLGVARDQAQHPMTDVQVWQVGRQREPVLRLPCRRSSTGAAALLGPNGGDSCSRCWSPTGLGQWCDCVVRDFSWC